jgi:hypothetical protein
MKTPLPLSLVVSFVASLVVSLTVCACATSPAAPRVSTSDAVSTTRSQRASRLRQHASSRHTEGAERAPVIARWTEKSRAGRRLVLASQLEYSVPLEVALDVSVETPPGVTLVSGEPAFRTSPGPTAQLTPDEREYVFDVAPDAAGEIVLSASFRSAAAGLFAKDTYPVGAPSPAAFVMGTALAEHRAREGGPSVELGGVDLGAPVPLDRE